MTVDVVCSGCIIIINQTFTVDLEVYKTHYAQHSMLRWMVLWVLSYGITCARAYMRVDANDDDVCLRMRVCVCLRACVCARACVSAIV